MAQVGCDQRMHVVDALKTEMRGSNKNMEQVEYTVTRNSLS